MDDKSYTSMVPC